MWIGSRNRVRRSLRRIHRSVCDSTPWNKLGTCQCLRPMEQIAKVAQGFHRDTCPGVRVLKFITNESITPLGLKSRIHCFLDNTCVRFSAGMTCLAEQSIDGCSSGIGVNVEPYCQLSGETSGTIYNFPAFRAPTQKAPTNFDVLLDVHSAGLGVDRVIGASLIVEVVKTRGCRLRHMLAAVAGTLDEHRSQRCRRKPTTMERAAVAESVAKHRIRRRGRERWRRLAAFPQDSRKIGTEKFSCPPCRARSARSLPLSPQEPVDGDKRCRMRQFCEAVAFNQKFLWSDVSLRLLADPRASPCLGPNLPLGATTSSACPIVADRISMPRKAAVVPLDDWLHHCLSVLGKFQSARLRVFLLHLGILTRTWLNGGPFADACFGVVWARKCIQRRLLLTSSVTADLGTSEWYRTTPWEVSFALGSTASTSHATK